MWIVPTRSSPTKATVVVAAAGLDSGRALREGLFLHDSPLPRALNFSCVPVWPDELVAQKQAEVVAVVVAVALRQLDAAVVAAQQQLVAVVAAPHTRVCMRLALALWHQTGRSTLLKPCRYSRGF